MDKKIEHKGIITKIEAQKLTVTIDSMSMCAHCQAKGMCGTILSTDTKKKDIEVKTTEGANYSLGQDVTVCLEQRLGKKAVVLGLLYPFLVLVVPIILLKLFLFPDNDVLCALIGFCLMAVYYFILYKCKDRIEKEFSFSLKE